MITTHKTNTALALLWHNLKPYSLHIVIQERIVRPIIEYACTVWTPHTAQDINGIEMIQRRAARFVYNNYCHSASVSSMLGSLGWHTLQARRNYLKLLLSHLYSHHLTISNQLLIIQGDTNRTFNVCILLVIATVTPFFHLLSDYGTVYTLILIIFMNLI